ncbi:VanW family protein [Deinococcus deserti]|uniref:Putative vanW protein n=1 Tax=Deinococcus deserti (strain DSM 17065 / CIP 109153 / LMG 22923 / VCD115) TaxID=546414 RepID=C1CWU5_DEIDV|nr:VanW family protein [Deinococcus deserti]ACO46662.1 putative vanW protein, precursor [Deinococcus deserti VCD115]
MKFWVAGVSAVALLGSALALGAASQSTGKLAPGLRVAGVDVGGLTREQAIAALGTRSITPPEVIVRAESTTWTVGADVLGWRADAETSIAAAEKITAERGMVDRVQDLLGQSSVQELPLVAQVDPVQAAAALNRLTAGMNVQPRDASVVFDKTSLKYVVKPDRTGMQTDVASAVKAYAATPTLTVLNIPVRRLPARIVSADLRPHVVQGNALMRPFTARLEGTERSGALTALQVANLYWVRENGIVPDDKALKAAFGILTDHVDQPASNARYTAKGKEFVKVREQAGVVTDRPVSYAAFRKAVLDPAQADVVFASKVSKPTLTIAALPDPKKLELITVGRSTYYGSSPARRINVATAANKIHGSVVAKGETFSFLEALGSITPENGFVGGLIISGGRTVDGLGGGVCQVSTTVFRALYQAGLPVVERNQHSYRVAYYEPQIGFEAAVYDPGVDLKMKNDTGGPLLIKAIDHPNKSVLTVEVWGIKQTRKVVVSPATILARLPHPPAQYVVNPRMRAGAVRQVDWAQDGYNLYITRTIKDAGTVRTDRVTTNYRPWRAVYETGPRG